VQVTFDPTDPRYYQTHIVQSFPRGLNAVLPQLPDQVTMRVRIQPVGLDVLNDLSSAGYLDPSIAAAMPTWDAAPLLTWTPAKATLTYTDVDGTPVTCVSTTAFNVAADKTPAPANKDCTP
jgi:hypothetical protein